MRINLFNAKNPNGLRLAVSVDILHQDISNTLDGELIYLIQLNPNLPNIKPIILNNVSQKNIQAEIKKGLTLIGDQIDWGELKVDVKAPMIQSIYPEPNRSNVNIKSIVSVSLIDKFPTSLINTSSLIFKVNGVDVTTELRLKELDQQVNITWIPKKILE